MPKPMRYRRFTFCLRQTEGSGSDGSGVCLWIELRSWWSAQCGCQHLAAGRGAAAGAALGLGGAREGAGGAGGSRGWQQPAAALAPGPRAAARPTRVALAAQVRSFRA